MSDTDRAMPCQVIAFPRARAPLHDAPAPPPEAVQAALADFVQKVSAALGGLSVSLSRLQVQMQQLSGHAGAGSATQTETTGTPTLPA